MKVKIWLVLTLVLTLLLLWSKPTTAESHYGELTWRTAKVTGYGGGGSCPGCVRDRNWGTYSYSLLGGLGRFFVNYQWNKKDMEGDYFRILNIYAYAKQHSICDANAGRLYIYNYKTNTWDYLGATRCGAPTVRYGGKTNGDHFDYGTNTVKLKLSSSTGRKNKLYEVWVDKIEYWYNWFPMITFNMHPSYYINETKLIIANFSVNDMDNDPVNTSYYWLYKNTTYQDITGLDLSVGDNIILVVRSCDPYNCTLSNFTTKIENFKPDLEIKSKEKVRGNQTINIKLTPIDLEMENQTHIIECTIGDKSGNVSTGLENSSLNLTAPSEEGKYNLTCSICDGFDCTNRTVVIIVDNTPPKFTNVIIPKFTNLKNIQYELDEPGYVEISCNDSEFSETPKCNEGYQELCIRPVDIVGNIGYAVCSNTTVDLTPPSFQENLTIVVPGQELEIPILEENLENASGYFGNESICSLKTGGLVCNTSVTPRGNNTVTLIAMDKAGNRAEKEVTVRVNVIPTANAMIPSTLYADSKLVCEPVNVSNEPDQSWNYSVAWLRNGQPLDPNNYTLTRGDNITCLLNITDALGEWSTANISAMVQNKPPEVSVSWEPEYPQPGDKVTFKLSAIDVDNDNVTWKAIFANETWNKSEYSLTPNISSPGNYTLEVKAWDGFDWANKSLVISYHLCGNAIVEPGEECDGSAPSGFKCQACKLVKIKPASPSSGGGSGGGGRGSGGGGGGGSGSPPEIIPKIFENLSDWIPKLEKTFGYDVGFTSTKTLWKILFTISKNMSWAKLVDEVPTKFSTVQCNIGGCKLENDVLVWTGTNITANQTVEITLVSDKELLLADMQKELDQSPAPTIEGEPATLATQPEPEQTINQTATKLESKIPEEERVPTLPILNKKPETAGPMEITGLLTSPMANLGISILISLVILAIGLKHRRNLRRLGIRLKAMATKMRPRS